MTGIDQRDCEQVGELLDFYIDRELPAAETATVAAHLAGCAQCRMAVDELAAFRMRLRSAAHSVPVPDEMAGRMIANAHRSEVAPFRSPRLMAIAAAAVLTIGVVGYQLGHLRDTAARQDSYLAQIAGETAPIMRVGLKDHVHCAVFRKLPARQPSFQEMTAELGPEYADLLPVLEKNTPPGMRVAMAHKCRYRGRQYVHLVATDGQHLMSLILAQREDGEAFEAELREVARESGAPLYSTGVRDYSIAGFETEKHLVYLVSDTDQTRNLRTLQAMTAPVREVLRRSEG